MAFPTLATSTTFSSAGTSATSHSATYPSSIASGDLLLAFLASDGAGETFTFPTGWAEIRNFPVDGGGSETGAVWYKIAAGTESGSFTIGIASSEQLLAYIWRVTGWHGTTVPEVSSNALGTGTAPDPNSLTPSWGADDTLWIAFYAANLGVATAWPLADNNASQHTTGAGVGCGGICSVGENASSKDVGAFTTDSSQPWGCVTVAVRPTASATFSPVDPFGMSGIFGI